MEWDMPRNLGDFANHRERAEWTENLPQAIQELQDVWSLEIGDPFQPGGQTAWVAPATSPQFGEVVLKVAWRHYEALDEAKGLREWDGDGTVRLLSVHEVDDNTTALLLERCHPGTILSACPEGAQDSVIAGLLRRLWKPPPFALEFRPLREMCNLWANEREGQFLREGTAGDAGLLHEGIELFRSLSASAELNVLLCTDLHAGNVLSSKREQWLVIDPKPFVGDPTYDALQHLLNCKGRLRDNPVALVARMADLCGLDPSRLGRWLFARCVIESFDSPTLLDIAHTLAESLD
jgi:streptomycin 6-kinase